LEQRKALSGKDIIFSVLRWIALFIIALVVIFPFFWALISSLKPTFEIIKGVSLLPHHPTLANYVAVFKQAPFQRFFFNSFVVSTVATLFAVITSVSSGFVFAKHRFPLKNLLFIVILATIMIPIQVYIIPLYLIMKQFGFINSVIGLIIPWIIMSTGIFFLRQNIAMIPNELLDAARIDGCSEFRILWQIIIPLSRSPMMAVAIISFTVVWNDFFWPLIIVNEQNLYTVNLGLTYFQRQYTIEYGTNMAAALLSSLPPLIIFLFLRRQILENITLGGLKY